MASPTLKMLPLAAAVVLVLCNIGLTPARARSAAYEQGTPFDEEQGECPRTVCLATLRTFVLVSVIPNIKTKSFALGLAFIVDSAVCKESVPCAKRKMAAP